jgi:hypothetical protein
MGRLKGDLAMYQKILVASFYESRTRQGSETNKLIYVPMSIIPCLQYLLFNNANIKARS